MIAIALSLFAAAQDPEIDSIYEELRKVDRVTPVVLVAQAVTPAVVFIQTEIMQVAYTWDGPLLTPREGAGSGVVIRPEGFIVTNYHVVKGASRIQVTFADDPLPWPAELVSFVAKEDLALLKVQERSISDPQTSNVPPLSSTSLTSSRSNSLMQEPSFPTARLGTSSDLMPGEQVIAIGNPHGQAHTVSTGIISGLHRDIPITNSLFFSDLIQTDASINFGNSGGPLLNIRGELIGINSAMNVQAENIGFAIPVDRVVEVLNDYLFPQARTSWLGFEVAGEETLKISHVWPGGPAEEAGLCEGDRLLAIDDKPLNKADDWLLATVGIPAGQKVDVEFARGSRRTSVEVAAWDKLDGLAFERLGLVARQVVLSSNRWLIVEKIAAGGPAERTGLQVGDLIAALQPEGERPEIVRDTRGLSHLLQRLSSAKPIELEIYRDDNRDRNYSMEERYIGRIVAR